MKSPATDLIYRKLDDKGDMLLGIGDLAFVKNLDAITQAIYTRLRLLRGEWWERRGEGLPLWQEILGQPRTETQRNMVDLLVIERINDTRGVTAVRDVDSFYTGRNYTFTCRVETIYGEANVEVTF